MSEDRSSPYHSSKPPRPLREKNSHEDLQRKSAAHVFFNNFKQHFHKSAIGKPFAVRDENEVLTVGDINACSEAAMPYSTRVMIPVVPAVITLYFDQSTTVAAVCHLIAKKMIQHGGDYGLFIPASANSLDFLAVNGEATATALSDGRTLDSYDVQHKPCLVLERKPRQLRLLTPNGTACVVQYGRTTRVQEAVYAVLNALEGAVEANVDYGFFHEKLYLKPGDTVMSYGLEDGAEVKLAPALRRVRELGVCHY